jgi:ATP-dependent DNA helicase PIF1
LFPTNSEIRNFNEQELSKLSGKNYVFFAKDEEIIPNSLRKLLKDCLARDKLELKVGAQVMLIKN